MDKPEVEYITLREHFEALRAADQRALDIKEKADVAALDLAREIQTYKDEKANELREQIASERHLYATTSDLSALDDKLTAQFKPLYDYIAVRQGRDVGISTTMAVIAAVIGFLLTLLTIAVVTIIHFL